MACEEKLHKLVLESNMNEAKDGMDKKTTEIEKSKFQIEQCKFQRSDFSSISAPRRSESGFSNINISSSGSAVGSCSGIFGSTVDSDRALNNVIMLHPINQSQEGQDPRDTQIAELTRLVEELTRQLTIERQKSELEPGRFHTNPRYQGDSIDSFSSKPKDSPAASAKAPPTGLGMQLGKKSQETNLFSVQSNSLLPPADPITVTIEERLNIVFDRNGDLHKFDLLGTLYLQILNEYDGLTQLQIENGDINWLYFEADPIISKDLFRRKKIISITNPTRLVPSSQYGVSLMTWQINKKYDYSLPLKVSCWPFVCENKTVFDIEYEASDYSDLQDVVISVPLPALRDPPTVNVIDGEWRYDAGKSSLEWSIPLIDHLNRNGQMVFAVPPADPSAFFPVSVKFAASCTSTYTDVKVVGIVNPLKGYKDRKLSQRFRLITDSYQINGPSQFRQLIE